MRTLAMLSGRAAFEGRRGQRQLPRGLHHLVQLMRVEIAGAMLNGRAASEGRRGQRRLPRVRLAIAGVMLNGRAALG